MGSSAKGKSTKTTPEMSVSPYFSAVFAIIATVIVWAVAGKILKLEEYRLLGVYLLAAVVGWYLGIPLGGSWRVFVHEFKHSLVSGIVGNPFKSIRWGSKEGYFEYSYTKETKSFNTLIMTAPYWLPLFSVLVLILLWVTQVSPGGLLYTSLVGWAFGVDCRVGHEDIHPLQTDLSTLIGGYWAGVFYIRCLNLFWLSLIGLLAALGSNPLARAGKELLAVFQFKVL